MPITDSRYFTYGSAHETLHGDDTKLIQYALYHPIIDRFVITSTSFALLQLVSVLFSGRYNLAVCRLDRVANFDRGLIDNQSVLNWTGNMGDIKFTRFPSYDKLLEPELLIEREQINFKDQEYLLAAAYWVDFLLVNTRILNQDFVSLYEDLLSEILPFKHPRKILTDKILHIIYREFDFATAEKQINQLISSYDRQDLSEFNL